MRLRCHLAAAIFLLTTQVSATEPVSLAERADQYLGSHGTPMDQIKPDNNGVIRAGIETNASFVAMPPEMLAKLGFNTQSEAWVHQDMCDADLIAVATASKAVPAFSTSRRMVFTQVSFAKIQVLRAKPAIHWREPLAVMVMAGDLTENGQRFVFPNNRDPGYIVGAQYLLKLRLETPDDTVFQSMGYWPAMVR